MYLSMTIIAHELECYDPVVNIEDDDMTILGLRLFSYNQSPGADYLYIGRNKDFFEKSISNEVLLVHRKSVISLHTEELEDVFDVVMNAFRFYQLWEDQLYASFDAPVPIEHLIASCTDIYGPMFFSTTSLQVPAFSRVYGKNTINKNWNDFWEYGTFSITELANMEGGQFLDRISGHWDCEVFYEDHVSKYPYSLMISQENSSGTLMGQLTIVSEVPFEKWQIQLAQVVKRALCRLSVHENAVDSGSVVSSLLKDFLQGTLRDSMSAERFYRFQCWSEEQGLMVILLKKDQAVSATYSYYQKNLKRLFPNVLMCPQREIELQEDGLICCVPLNKYHAKQLKKLKKSNSSASMIRYSYEAPDSFLAAAAQMGLNAYQSYPSSGVKNLHELYCQARVCCARQCNDFYQIGLKELLSFDETSGYRQLALHPAIRMIADYDLQQDAENLKILTTYLRNERDRVKTANQLYMHKNTLVYRLQQLVNLFDLNLEDAYEREYLLVSIRCFLPE